MRIRILTALLATIAFCSSTAFSQAALETLMTHSTSTAVTTHAGTALGNAINRAAGNVAHQTAATTGHVTAVPQNASATRRPAKAPTNAMTPATPYSAPVSGNGSLIASIQGGEPKSKAQILKSCDTTSASGTQAGSCAVVAPQNADHPSVVNLPAPQ